ncbi:MAG: FmdB family zinc ribbon protein [Acidobacteriota bacterium]
MPIYEYSCSQCGARIEVMQRMSDDKLTQCTELTPRDRPANCSQDGALRKQISAPAFQFKGSGWYVTDYKKSDGGKDAKEAGGTGGDAKDGDAGKGGDKAASSGGGDTGSTTKSNDGASTSTAKKPAAASKPASGGA